MTNLGEVYGVLAGADAVVHLAAIPVAYSHPNEVTFQNNVMSTYHILEAAGNLGIKKAVISSSESSYGICFSRQNLGPQYVPIDEEHPGFIHDPEQRKPILWSYIDTRDAAAAYRLAVETDGLGICCPKHRCRWNQYGY